MSRAAYGILAVAMAGGCGGGGDVSGDGGSASDGSLASDGGSAIDAAVGPPALCVIDLDCGGAVIPDEPKIDCALTVGDGKGAILYDGAAGVEVRGRSSQGFPKQQYSVELRTDAGLERAVSLLGMGAESDWVFNGAYIDRALFRNKVLYELFQSFGGTERYAAELAYCELTLEGDWLGIYLLTERVKRDDDRVVIAADTALDGSTFILKQDDHGWRALAFGHGFWRTVYPNEAVAQPGQLAGIDLTLQAWEQTVAGTGDIFDVVDLDSAVDFVLLQEFAKNNDAYFLSVHIWKDQGGLIHFLPWDLDLSFGQPLYNKSTDPHGWIVHRPQFIAAMAGKPAFRVRLIERWEDLRTSQLSEAALTERIDAQLATIADHVAGNFERWPIEEIQFLDNQLPPRSSFEEEVGLVRSWIAERLAWMDDNIAAY